MTNGDKIIKATKRRIHQIPAESAKKILEDIAMIRDNNSTAGSVAHKLVTRSLTLGFWTQSLDFMVFRELGEQSKKEIHNEIGNG